jgi:hypothetical protein
LVSARPLARANSITTETHVKTKSTPPNAKM